MGKTPNTPRRLEPEDKNILAIFTRAWFVEGLFYTTCIAFLWTNEEPSKLNTLLAAWSAYALVAFALYQAVKSGVVLNPVKWIRIYFIQCLLLLFACDFIWLQTCVARAGGDYFDPIRYDYYAVILSKAGMNPGAVFGQNYTGTIWYAGFIYWIFGVSKFYVTLFNGALSFITWILFTSTMSLIEGHTERWQWLRFGMLLPDFIINFSHVSKEPLCAFVVASGIWIIARAVTQKKIPFKLLLPLIFILLLGLAVRAVTSAIIIIAAGIWLWKYWGRKRRIAAAALVCGIVIAGYFSTNYVMRVTGSAPKDWGKMATILLNPELRMWKEVDYPTSGSWNVIAESAPLYLMPIIAPVKGFFMMISPMPLWKLNIIEVLDTLGTKARDAWVYHYQLFQKGTAWLFVLSLPWLLTGFLDVYHRNRRLWIMTSFTFFVLIAITGFLVRGMIIPRYRPMFLPFWLSACGVGYYYGRPKRYIPICIGIVIVGFAVYMVPKLG